MASKEKKWAIITPCSKPVFAYVVAEHYEEELAIVMRTFKCCRDHVDIELFNEDKHGKLGIGHR